MFIYSYTKPLTMRFFTMTTNNYTCNNAELSSLIFCTLPTCTHCVPIFILYNYQKGVMLYFQLYMYLLVNNRVTWFSVTVLGHAFHCHPHIHCHAHILCHGHQRSLVEMRLHNILHLF